MRWMRKNSFARMLWGGASVPLTGRLTGRRTGLPAAARLVLSAASAMLLVSLLGTYALAPGIHAQAAQPAGSSTAHAHPKNKASKPGATGKASRSGKKTARTKAAGRAGRAAKLKQAFVASTELRPMAQQLAATRLQPRIWRWAMHICLKANLRRRRRICARRGRPVTRWRTTTSFWPPKQSTMRGTTPPRKNC